MNQVQHYKIEVSILKDVATLTIDTSGVGLHKRGYRMTQGEAPLKETFAAALVKISKWSPNQTVCRFVLWFRNDFTRSSDDWSKYCPRV